MRDSENRNDESLFLLINLEDFIQGLDKSLGKKTFAKFETDKNVARLVKQCHDQVINPENIDKMKLVKFFFLTYMLPLSISNILNKTKISHDLI